jgi:TonB-dependent SusC/RagA subfamily outer membrane receptor
MAKHLPAREALVLGLTLGMVASCAHVGKKPDRTAASGGSGVAEATTVTSADLRRNASEPIERVLMGLVPGLWITRTSDGGIAIRIRGSTSIEGSTAPLFVLDGVPIEPGPNGSLTGINPYDIETIEVFKDAVSTAMYGMRGANGVIVITSKRPGR